VKNQYFGDVNDYLKYGLLRCFAETGWHVGVCWMLTPNDGRADGRKTEYLTKPANWREFDPILFDALAAAVFAGRRSIEQIESQPPLIPDAEFFSEVVPEQARSRDAWFLDASTALAAANLLFFDPDNGVE
jgi:hypothetical protein